MLLIKDCSGKEIILFKEVIKIIFLVLLIIEVIEDLGKID